MEMREYNREQAVRYARRWAFGRYPLFYDFSAVGGNCTNFVSQCLLAGTCQMNFTPTFGWYYISPEERAPAWTGVEFLYNFLTSNTGTGPFARLLDAGEAVRGGLMPGDVIQLGRINRRGEAEGDYYHTLLVTGFGRRGILVAAQTDDALDRPLSTYSYQRIRYLHIEGFRTDERYTGACFEDLIEGRAIGIEA